MSEKQIENQILCFLEECGIYARKIQNAGTYDIKRKAFRKSFNRFASTGMPDISGCIPGGRRLDIEVKSKTGRPTQAQLKAISDINSHGGYAFISRSVEQTYDTIEKVWPEIQNFRHLLKKYQLT